MARRLIDGADWSNSKFPAEDGSRAKQGSAHQVWKLLDQLNLQRAAVGVTDATVVNDKI